MLTPDCNEWWLVSVLPSPPSAGLKVTAVWSGISARPATRWWKFLLKLSAWSHIIITLPLSSPLTILVINWWKICCLLVRHQTPPHFQIVSSDQPRPAVYQIWHHQPQLEQISEKSSGVTSSAQSLLVVAFMWPSGFSQFIPNGKMTGDCCWC